MKTIADYPTLTRLLTPLADPVRAVQMQAYMKNRWWCPKKYAASNAPVIDIEKTDGKCLNVIEHLLGKTAGFTHCAAHPLAQTAVISFNADGISLPHLMLIILKGLKKRHPVVRSNSVISNAQCFQALF